MRERHLLKTLAATIAAMLLTFVASTTAVAESKAKATGVQLYGYQLSADCSRGTGVFTFNTASPSGMTLVSDAVQNYGGGAYAQGTYYSSFYSESDDGSKITMPIRLFGYDTATWSQTSDKQGYEFTTISADLTFDPETQVLYGVFSDDDYSGSYNIFGRVVYQDVVQEGTTFHLYRCEAIGTMPESMVAIAANRDGKMYVFGKSGKLYTVDKYSGKTTLVGSTGVNIVPFKQSATCDYNTGKLYWAALDADAWATKIVEVDPATAHSTTLVDFGYDESAGTGEGTYEQFTGLYMKQDLNLATLPNAVENLSVAMTSLTEATVSFTMPTNNVAGEALSGTLGYTVRINGETILTGTAAPGATVTKAVSTTITGTAVFGVVAEIPATTVRPAAISAIAKVEAHAGNDAPKDPTNVKAKANDGVVTISWTASTESAHGGIFNKDNVTYSVYRFIKGNATDSVAVATGIKTTTATDRIESQERTTYYYKVIAFNGEAQSNGVASNNVTIGVSVPLPYQNKLNTQDLFNEMDVIDANGDDATWNYNSTFSMAAYTASNENAADDWLIAPAVYVKKGAAYKFSFGAVNSYPDELVSAAVGTAPSAAGMTTEIIAPTVISYNPRRHSLTGTYRATEDGLRYFGVHAISDKATSTLYVDDLKITEIPATAPNTVSDLTVTAGDKGATTANIAFKAPTTTLGGTALTGTMNIQITRDGKSLTTLTNVAPGSACSYDDASAPQGMLTYAVTAVDASGVEGLDASVAVFVGNDEPGEVRNLKAYEDASHDGLIHVTWDAPKGKHGGYINPADLTYYVSVGSETTDRNVGNATHFDDQLDVAGGKQKYSAYSVYAVSSTGGGRENWLTVTAIGGPALKAPMVESFPNASMKSGPWITKVTNGKIGEAYCYVMSESTATIPEDGDGGLQSFSAEKNGKSVRSESPKVDINTLTKPMLTFWAYMNGKGEKMRVSVQKDYKEFEQVLEVSTDRYQRGWHRFSVDLTPFKGSKYVRVGIEGESVKDLYDFLAYDNVAIVDDANYDLMSFMLSSDETELVVGDEALLNFTVRNNGKNTVKGTDYELVLLKNGKETSRTQGVNILQDRTETITLTDNTTVLDPEQTVYSARIEYAADQMEANNTSGTVTFKLIKPEYPVPTNLRATSGNGAELSWTAPDLLNLKPVVTTESFDDYDAFIIDNVGKWTMYDADMQNTIRITLNELFGPLQYNHAGEPMAFQVFNPSEAGITFKSWTPHSGNQMLVSFSCASTDGGFSKEQNDDWLISPELIGTAQTVKFYAKAGMASATPERMEVLYSTTDNSVSSFKRIGETINVRNASSWDEYTVALPEGAKYFAIRCVSKDKFALLVDDISYVAAGSVPLQLTLNGYNVYRDGKKLNSSLVDKERYNDYTAVNNNTYSYQVTAVYDKGESAPTDPAKLDFASAINNVEATMVSVTGGDGVIVVAGANGKMVKTFAANGMMEAQLVAGHRTCINASAGLHIVNVGGKTYKVFVK